MDMRDIDCELFLQSDRPEEVLLAILCNYQKKGANIFVQEIFHRLRELAKEEMLLNKYIRQVEILSLLRNLQHYVSKEAEGMITGFDIKKDVRYQQGMKKGMERGKKKGKEEGLQEGIEKGLLEGLELALQIKFGDGGMGNGNN